MKYYAKDLSQTILPPIMPINFFIYSRIPWWILIKLFSLSTKFPLANFKIKIKVAQNLWFIHFWCVARFGSFKLATLLKLILLHGCFSRFLNCTNGTKLRNAPHLRFMGSLLTCEKLKQV